MSGRNSAAVLFACILAAFAADLLSFNMRRGHRPLGKPAKPFDAMSERRSSLAAQRFLEEGFSTTLLPRYELGANKGSGSEVILRSDVYTHYLPGPDEIACL